MRMVMQTFLQSFHIQRRVISALLKREIITRYGRNNIGFMWLFVEPLVMTLIIALFWKYARGDTRAGLPVIAFMITGYPIAMLWRNGANRSSKAIGSNKGMLYHRNVRVLDLFLSRLLLEIFGTTTAFVLIMLGFYLVGWISQPADILYMVYAWMLMDWFSLGLGLVVGSLSERYEVFGRMWSMLSFVMFPLSGIFYMVDALPKKAQEIVLHFPMVHGTEMMRQGYFGARIHTHEDVVFVIVVNLVLLLLGLMLVKKYGRGIDAS